MMSYKFIFIGFFIASLGGCGGSNSDRPPVSSSSATGTVSSLTTSSLSSVANVSSSAISSASSSNAASVPTTGIFNVNYGQFTGVYTLLEEGIFYGIHYVGGSTLAGHPYGVLNPENSTSNLEPITWANFIDDSGQTGNYETAPKFGRSFVANTINFKISGGFGTFTAQATQQKMYETGSLKSLYNDPLPMDAITGSYTGVVRTVGIMSPSDRPSSFIIDDQGVFTSTAMGCTFTGQFVRHGVTGVFDIDTSISGVGCRLASNLKGIATPVSVVNNKPTFAVQLNHPNNTQTAVFLITKQ